MTEQTHENRVSAGVLDQCVLFIAAGLGLGRIPFAPGTWGSLLGLPLAWSAQHLSLGWRITLAAGCFLLGVPICARAARLLHSHDPSCVVFDEIAAFPIVFLITPMSAGTAAAGFALFRLADIAKPFPARELERLPGGWGIMADDCAAGVYAALALYGASRWLLPE